VDTPRQPPEENASPASGNANHRRLLGWAATITAGLAGAAAGVYLGYQMRIVWLGAIAALNGALFASLVVGTLAERWVKKAERR
jgi:hypothetical protein